MSKPKKIKRIKAWIIEDGRWATNQMLVYQTKLAAEKRVLQGGMSEAWRIYPCEIIIKNK